MGEPRVILYSRPGCHLCADAALLLDDLLGTDGFATVDVETDDDLLLRYGGRVPVVAVDGVDRLEAPINGPDLIDVLAEAGL